MTVNELKVLLDDRYTVCLRDKFNGKESVSIEKDENRYLITDSQDRGQGVIYNSELIIPVGIEIEYLDRRLEEYSREDMYELEKVYRLPF